MEFKRIIVRPYSKDCGGARDVVKILSDEGIDAKRVYSTLDSYVPEKNDFIVNWGASYPPEWAYHLKSSNEFLNHWTAVGNSVSKIRSFENFKKHKIQTPDWTLSRETALGWAKAGHWVVCREIENGYDGKGLVLAKSQKEVVYAPLYTKFIKNTVLEFRAYIFLGGLIDLLYKYAPAGVKSDVIRTETNGWEYGRSSYHISDDITKIAKAAIKANGMDFGGVDIIRDNQNELYVLETNSEPGIGKITAQRFAKAIREAAGL